LPDGLYDADEAAQAELARLVVDLEYDLKDEVVNSPRPVVYRPGTIEDGGTLSGIARLFYGDASKWRKIYDANRTVIKNPNQIHSSMKLKIPK
jgi:nucleoid-associated protein YgaU